MKHGYAAEGQFLHSYEASKTPSSYEGILSKIELPKKAVILDLSAGRGNEATSLGKLNPSAKIFELDIEQEAFNRERDPKNFIIADLSKNGIPLAENQIDLAHSKDAFLHLEDKLKHFKQVFEVLKNGGQFLLTTYVTNGTAADTKAFYYVEFSGNIKPYYFLRGKGGREKVLQQIKQDMVTEGSANYLVSPPYFPCSAAQILKYSKEAGFEQIKGFPKIWQPGDEAENEFTADIRRVYLFKKP